MERTVHTVTDQYGTEFKVPGPINPKRRNQAIIIYNRPEIADKMIGVFPCSGQRGGRFAISVGSEAKLEKALEALKRQEKAFDIEIHQLTPAAN